MAHADLSNPGRWFGGDQRDRSGQRQMAARGVVSVLAEPNQAQTPSPAVTRT
jgi:hypothetical protein